MFTSQYPSPLSALPSYASLAKSPILFHIGSIAVAVRASLTIFSFSSTSRPIVSAAPVEPNWVEFERNQQQMINNSEKAELTKIKPYEKKCHYNQNSSKMVAKTQSECDRPNQAKQQCLSLDQSNKQAPQKVQQNKRISKKVIRTALFLRHRETRGSMKVSHRMERVSRRWKYGCGNAFIEVKPALSIKQKRESLMSRLVLQWKIDKQDSSFFGREFKYLLQ